MRTATFLGAVALLFPLPALADHDRPDIVETALAAGSFKTLAKALTAAGLVDTLKGEGPFTVFAPTDEAFARLPEGTLASLLRPENKPRLVAILQHHVVAGAVKAQDAIAARRATTLLGQRLEIASKDGVLVSGARVIKADLEARNGVIHVIDRVILPETRPLLEVAGAAGSFRTLAAAIQAAGLEQTLGGEGPFTVFAPTDEAFAQLPAGTLERLLRPENKAELTRILTLHVVKGRVFSDQALAARAARSLEGGTLTVEVRDVAAFVNGARLVQTDVQAANGVIHVIDRVILPSSK